MGETFLPWLLFLLYVLAIIGLTWWNRRRAVTMSIFAIGTRSLPPFLVGLSLAANMTSVATFVINPGMVHAFGWAGVVGYGIAAPLGIFANDLYGSLARAAGVAAERIAGRLLPIGRGFLVVLAPVTFLLARDQILDPSLSVAIFAQNGVYGLFAGGVQGARVGRGHVRVVAGEGGGGPQRRSSAACAIVASTLVVAIGVVLRRAGSTEG